MRRRSRCLLFSEGRRAPPRRPAGSTLRVCHSASRKAPNTTSPIILLAGKYGDRDLGCTRPWKDRDREPNSRSLSSYWSEPRSSSNPRTSTHSGNSNEVLREFTTAGMPRFVDSVRARHYLAAPWRTKCATPKDARADSGRRSQVASVDYKYGLPWGQVLGMLVLAAAMPVSTLATSGRPVVGRR